MFRTAPGPHGIDLTAPGGIEKLLAFHRGLYGHACMDGGDGQQGGQGQGGQPGGGDGNGQQPPERPEGVSEDEWNALGDPGKRAIVRERERATRAEHDLAAARAARPAPPKNDQNGKGGDGGQGQGAGDDGKGAGDGRGGKPAGDDIAAIVQQAVAAAIAPFQQAQQQQQAEDAARQVAQAVTDAAKGRLHDASDALAQIDITTLTDGSGRADQTKITAALDDLVQRKPHLAKVVDDRRRPGADSFLGGGAPAGVSTDDQVKAALAKMQASAGVKLADA